MNEVGAGAGGGTAETESDEMLRTRPNTIKRSTPTGEYAVRGARIECDCGDGFDVVNIPLCHGVYSGEHPLVSVKDMKVRENICNGFGTCITPEGEKYDCMKEIRVDHEWINENKVRFHIDGEEVLATGAITMCSKHGGGIHVVESGQDGKYVTQSTDEVNVAEKRNMMKNLGEGVDSIKDVPEIPAAILAGLTTIDACEAKIKELGQMWHEADGNPALQEYYHRQANQIREHAITLSTNQPYNEQYVESLKRQLESVDGSDPLRASSNVGEDILGMEVKGINELTNGLDYGYGFVVIEEERLPIYIPPFVNGSNGEYDNDGWSTIKTKNMNYKEFNVWKVIGSLGSNYEEEMAVATVDLDKVIYLNGSKSGRVQNLSTQTSKSTGMIAGLLGLSELITSYKNSVTWYNMSIRIQKNSTDKRVILEIESNRNPLAIHAGSSYYHLDAGYLNQAGRIWFVKDLKDKLISLGYGEYVTKYNVNIYNTIDSRHANDFSHGYLGLSSNNQLIMMPKLYPNDKMEIVHNTEFLYVSGFSTGHIVDYDLTSDLRRMVSLSEYGLELLDVICDGKIKFEK